MIVSKKSPFLPLHPPPHLPYHDQQTSQRVHRRLQTCQHRHQGHQDHQNLCGHHDHAFVEEEAAYRVEGSGRQHMSHPLRSMKSMLGIPRIWIGLEPQRLWDVAYLDLDCQALVHPTVICKDINHMMSFRITTIRYRLVPSHSPQQDHIRYQQHGPTGGAPGVGRYHTAKIPSQKVPETFKINQMRPRSHSTIPII